MSRANGKPVADHDDAQRWIERIEARRRNRPDEAWRILQKGFARVLRGALPARRGELWRLRGHVLRSLRETASATDAYRRAERWFARAGMPLERGRCAIGLVDSLMYLGRYEEAKRTATWGRRVLARTADEAARARLLNNEGNLYHRLDQPERALRCYKRSRVSLARARDRRGAALVDGNIANCFSLLGRCREARRLYGDARRILAQRGFTVDALNAEYNLAYLDFLEHRHERALDGLERVRGVARERGSPSLAALATLDRAEILLRLGAHHDALEEAGPASVECAALGLAYEQAKAQTFVALAEFRLGRLAAARRRLERSLAAFHSEGNAVWAGEALVGLATVWRSERSPHAAALLLSAAVDRFARARDVERQGCALALLARACNENGRLRAASSSLKRALRLLRRQPSLRLRHFTQMGAAELALARGDRSRARRHLRSAARQAEHLAARILDEQWRASYWGDWGMPHQELVQLELASGRVAAAFEILETGRGRALATPAAGRGSRTRFTLPSAARAWAVAVSARDRNRTTRSALRETSRETPAAGNSRSATLFSPGLARLLSATPPRSIRVGEVQRSLDPGTVLLDYTLYRGILSAFLIDSTSVLHLPSLASELAVTRLCHAVLFGLRSASIPSVEGRAFDPGLDETLTELASLVVWPALARHPRSNEWRTLAMVPVGPLTRIPWAALPMPDGRRLCRALETIVVPGLRVGLARRPTPDASGPPLVVAVDTGELASLEHEAETIARAFPGTRVLSGRRATAERFRRESSGAAWIHFAGHGQYEARAPHRSGLRMADRWLRAEEIEQLELSAKWITLSACQTARALVRPGEEWFGLARTLLLAGARVVVAAQWDVEDTAAARLMTRLYGHIATGLTLGSALARAQADDADGGVNSLDWAAFVALGGPRSAAVRIMQQGRAERLRAAYTEAIPIPEGA